uniref:Uncharacterized protein n=1 Tax=Salarias fasciatus TaxID=181472 RepID=A0A672J3A8_SALFA
SNQVWSLLNGLNLHKLEPVAGSEVSALTCVPGSKVLAVGWSQRIAQYDVTADLKVKADMSWKSRGVHRADVLAVCPCPALGVVATASYDGEIVVWRLDVQGPLLHLRRQSLQLVFCLGLKRLFPAGRFYAPEEPGRCVPCLSSDQPENAVLVSGSTAGRLQVWDISRYALDTLVKINPNAARSWTAHEAPLACAEVLELSERLLVFTASVDGSAGLWTASGVPVGLFGRQDAWSITGHSSHSAPLESGALPWNICVHRHRPGF